ncbi:MAG: ribonuclease H family protein [Lentimicrobiaceae bacterium]|jgi:ribonuclease HI|nr:ribonuclease H family protein [Lentimicrobiaceae bacterium]
MSKKKFYVIWKGPVGIYDDWNVCKNQLTGFKGALYKGFPDRESAEKAYAMGYETFVKASGIDKILKKSVVQPIGQSIAVDAACSGNPGKMEYRGVFVETGTELFKSPLFDVGTNNIGEFLAIVHCLAWQQQKKIAYPIYSDSVNAISWIKAKKARTKLPMTPKTASLFDIIHRAENWLINNQIQVDILKWDTENWGEIPADFGRK